jgi:hypothetical protein
VTTGRDGYFVLPGVGKKFERDPDRPVLVKASGEDTEGAFAVLEETIGPGGGGPLHVYRDSDELIYVLEGEFRFRIGDFRRSPCPGSVWTKARIRERGYDERGEQCYIGRGADRERSQWKHIATRASWS